MKQIQNELKQLKKEIAQIKVFCEAIVDGNTRDGELGDVPLKNMGAMIYRKSQPWFRAMDNLRVNIIKNLVNLDRRLTKLEEKLK